MRWEDNYVAPRWNENIGKKAVVAYFKVIIINIRVTRIGGRIYRDVSNNLFTTQCGRKSLEIQQIVSSIKWLEERSGVLIEKLTVA